MRRYIMESSEETRRLDLKTNRDVVVRQARWAGIKAGMRVADLGFGSGKTTDTLNRLVHPEGSVVGVDIAGDRIEFAQAHYHSPTISYVCRDICNPLDDLGRFDFIWVRFVLEYHRAKSFEMVRNISRNLNPGGILCLIDLDHNCMNHFGLPQRLEKALFDIMKIMETDFDFDPYIGRKLYAYLYDLEFENISVDLAPHHLFHGRLKESDMFNWTQKVKVAVRQSGFHFKDYPGGYEEFFAEFKRAFEDPRRFTYTPVICCRGTHP